MDLKCMTLSSHFVAPSEIQSELNRMWESFDTTTVMRACLFNLVFYTSKNHRSPYIEGIAQKVIEKFPSRVIFVAVDKEAKEDYIKTAVSIMPSSKGEFDVACDYIHIETGGTFFNRIPFVILPHILPDLPVYLIWGEDPSQKDPLCLQLEQFTNRFIFDSESADHLPHFAQSALDHYEKSQTDIADLNWARIENWREMLSTIFYTEDKLKKIENSQKITIVYNSQQTSFFCHTKIQAIYLQAWLACQLGWQFERLQDQKNVLIFSYRGKLHPIEIVLSPVQETKLPPGLILSVDIQTTQKEHFSFIRHLEQWHQIRYQFSTTKECFLPSYFTFSKAELGHSLVKEICHRGTSEHYLRVLNLLKQMDTYGLC